MKETAMRISNNVLEDLKLLKSVIGKGGTHQELLHKLVKAELRKTHAETGDGYQPVGTVVGGPDGRVLVIKEVGSDFVDFGKGNSVINGSSTCLKLKHLASCGAEYDGGMINE